MTRAESDCKAMAMRSIGSPCVSNPALSVVIPIRNEIGNIAPLVDELEQALVSHTTFEIVYVYQPALITTGEPRLAIRWM